MNKNDLIGAVAEASGLTRTDATKAARRAVRRSV